jgi:hypothetical protein
MRSFKLTDETIAQLDAIALEFGFTWRGKPNRTKTLAFIIEWIAEYVAEEEE